jgi:hypothetical protein
MVLIKSGTLGSHVQAPRVTALKKPGEINVGVPENIASNMLCVASGIFFLRLVVLSQRREHPGSESSHLKESELVYRIAVFLKFHNPQRHGTNCFIILFWA